MIIACILATALVAAEPQRILIEAESPQTSDAIGTWMPQEANLLSGGGQLMHEAERPCRITYAVTVPTAGTYDLFARELGWSRNMASAVRWRVDNQPWTTVEQSWGLPPQQTLGEACWLEWGRAQLTPGDHVLTVETLRPAHGFAAGEAAKNYVGVPVANTQFKAGTRHRLAVDCFVLTTGAFHPDPEHARILRASGLLREGELRDDGRVLAIEVDDGTPSLLDRVHPRGRAIGNADDDRLRRDGDRLVTADGRPFTWWAVSGPNVPARAEAVAYARRARRMGVTLVRLHTLDGELCNPWTAAGRNYQLDPERLDRLDWFVACLKREGIYVMLDALYNWVWAMSEADGLPPGVYCASRVRTQFYWDESLQQLNRDFLRRLLTHVNPYTGVAYGDDPVTAVVTAVNENGMFFYALENMHAYHREMLRARWNRWLAGRGDRAALARAWGEALQADEDAAAGTVALASIHDMQGAATRPAHARARLVDQARFYHDVQTAFYNGVRDFIHNELGYRHILVHGSGWFGPGWLDWLDESANLPGMDLYDQHGYFHNGLMVDVLGNDQPLPLGTYHLKHHALIHLFSRKQPAGIPTIVTEWMADGIDAPMVMACYGALHGWDGLFQYRLDTWDGVLTPGPTPPWHQWQYPLASLAFTGGAIRPAPVVRRHVITPTQLYDPQRTNPDNGTYALIGRCETSYDAAALPLAGDRGPCITPAGDVVSVTGELTWRKAAPALLIRAPRLQGLVGRGDGQAVELGAVTLTVEAAPASVCLGALDGLPLTTSGCMLLTVVGECRGRPRPEGAKRGHVTAPFAMRPVTARLVFAQPVRAVWQLDRSGRRVADMPLGDGGRVLELGAAATGVWYEVAR